jgi:hypothetical protein
MAGSCKSPFISLSQQLINIGDADLILIAGFRGQKDKFPGWRCSVYLG